MLKNGTVAPWSPHYLRASSARKPHGLRTTTIWRLRRLRGNFTEIAWFSYNLHTASIRIYHGLPPRERARKRMMLVDNVNTYAVARSHLRCPKNCTENCRQIYRTAPGARWSAPQRRCTPSYSLYVWSHFHYYILYMYDLYFVFFIWVQ